MAVPPARDVLVTDRIYAAVALVAAVAGAAEVLDQPGLLGLLLLALVPWALVVTGREPPQPMFAALALLPVAAVVAVHDVGSAIFMTTAAASRIASRTDDRRVLAVVTAAAVALPFLPVATGHAPNVGNAYFAFGNLFGVLVGLLLRRAARLSAELRAAQQRLGEAAVREERQRIARDVHDLVAHSLTVVVLHVGGARRVLRSDPGLAEQALADAERVCRESLDGIRGVVGLLRDVEEAPALSLDLGALYRTYRAAGLTVRGDAPDLGPLPLAVRVTLYRVVQESLANAARHGGTDGAAEVAVGIDEAAVSVRVTSRGTASAEPSRGGYGLVGLREQVQARGGEITSRAGDGGWVVACSLPVPAAPRPLGAAAAAS